MKQPRPKLFFLFFIVTSLMQSCVTVKPYQRYYLNDYEMQSGIKPESEFENYIRNIREGSSEAGGLKATGGCGCN